MMSEYESKVAQLEKMVTNLEADKEQHLRVIESLKQDVAHLLQVNAEYKRQAIECANELEQLKKASTRSLDPYSQF